MARQHRGRRPEDGCRGMETQDGCAIRAGKGTGISSSPPSKDHLAGDLGVELEDVVHGALKVGGCVVALGDEAAVGGGVVHGLRVVAHEHKLLLHGAQQSQSCRGN